MATKPVITYQSAIRPLTLDNNAAIVREKIDSTTYQNWADKSSLVTYVDSLYVPPTSDTYMLIHCGCGSDYTYANSAAVPASDMTCSCGRWVFKYGS